LLRVYFARKEEKKKQKKKRSAVKSMAPEGGEERLGWKRKRRGKTKKGGVHRSLMRSVLKPERKKKKKKERPGWSTDEGETTQKAGERKGLSLLDFTCSPHICHQEGGRSRGPSRKREVTRKEAKIKATRAYQSETGRRSLIRERDGQQANTDSSRRPRKKRENVNYSGDNRCPAGLPSFFRSFNRNALEGEKEETEERKKSRGTGEVKPM